MATLEEKLDKTLKTLSSWEQELAPAVQYAKTGSQKFLKKVSPKNSWCLSFLVKPLASEIELTETGRRLLEVLARSPRGAFCEWAEQWSKAAESEKRFAAAMAEAKRLGISDDAVIDSFAKVRDVGTPEAPRPWAQWLVEVKDTKAFARLLLQIGSNDELFKIIVARRLKDVAQFLEFLIQKEWVNKLSFKLWGIALRALGGEGKDLAKAALGQLKTGEAKFALASELIGLDPIFKKEAILGAKHAILNNGEGGAYELWYGAQEAALWLLGESPEECGAVLREYFGAPISKGAWQSKRQMDYKAKVLEAAIEKMGREAIPFAEACFATSQPELQLKAIQHWIRLANPAEHGAIEQHFRDLLASNDAATVARAIRIAGDWDVAALEDAIWPMLGSKSRPVRDAAAAVLAKLGDSRLPKAGELWSERKADTRIAAANWLKGLNTPKAAEEIKARLEKEEDEDVRDSLLMALEKITGSAGGSVDDIKSRIRSTLKKAGKSPVPWLDPKKLPVVRLNDGEKLSPEWLSYLLYRQSRVNEMRADLEAKPLYALIDRSTSGDLALAVLNAFLGSKVDADDRWALAFAAILGDDRIIPRLRKQIDEWAENMRGKLAEHAVQALALMGSDTALLTVDAMAIRYRSKNKNIGKAAADAFAAAAEARGLTVEELGDLVVPWLGFKPGEPRLIETAKGKIEARIGNDFKLTYYDVATKKKLAKLPDSAPSELKAEFKEISAALKEAVKSQLLRLETLMVRQFRWPVARWEELFLQHPLLFPFAQRLVWGCYDRGGKLLKTFRALEDRSLTDNADASYVLAKSGSIGIVHPLELTAADREQWITHLADYAVEAPFSQLDRPVVSVKLERKGTKFGAEVEGTELNALTFRGRAEKLGWTRGSVCDAGGINFYLKRFQNSGVDVFVGVEGMFIGVGMDDEVTLGKTFFVKTGSVKIGSYEYDEPGDEKDERLVEYGRVPEIAFSEAMGDLTKIAGKSQAEEDGAGDA